MTALYFFRSLLFSICFYINSIQLVIFVFLGRCLFLKKTIKKASKNWAKVNVLLLQYICGVKYKVIGTENIPQNNFLIVSKHQSTWETYFLFQYFRNYLACVVKKELLKIPGIGTALKAVGCIAINRNDGIHALKRMVEQSKIFVKKERRSLLIFPQGTRVPLNSSTIDYPYRGGFVSIAKENQLDLLPIALDSGKCWPKFSFIKRPGVINVKIAPVIKYNEYKNLTKNEVVKLVENAIESNQKLLE
ncbi:MAG: 1-acyl-sn-glycerol-3-phosphate acyltransferase [Rickettsiales bacterium]|nr:1-acyl-sn-glycerol-3-phosphate acyltransferase [Rickettsiales bacterium]